MTAEMKHAITGMKYVTTDVKIWNMRLVPAYLCELWLWVPRFLCESELWVTCRKAFILRKVRDNCAIFFFKFYKEVRQL